MISKIFTIIMCTHTQELLTGLLSDEEMQDMIENFDRLDVNQGKAEQVTFI